MRLVLIHKCRPRAGFGGGDAAAGTRRIVELAEAADHVARIRAEAQGRGLNTDKLRVTRRRDTEEGPVDEEVSLFELEGELRPMYEVNTHCEACPANLTGGPLGCVVADVEPLSAEAEAWWLGTLAEAGTPGGDLGLAMVRDIPLRRAEARSWRGRWLAAKAPPARSFKVPGEGVVKVSGEDLLGAVLVKGEMSPVHALGLLLWSRALELDGEEPGWATDPFDKLLKIKSTEERASRTQVVGDIPDGPGFGAVAALWTAFHRAWVAGARLVVEPAG